MHYRGGGVGRWTGAGWATPLGTNVLVNGNAEAGAGSVSGNDVEPIPGWTTTSNFTAVQYGAPQFSDASVSSSIGGGTNFFASGPSTAFSSATQNVDVGDLATQIDAGALSATLSGFLGGFDGQDDDMTVTASFLDASSATLSTLTIGPVTQPDRGGLTNLLFRTADDSIPDGTRSIKVEMDATRFQGSYDDGYADNLSLVLTGSVPPPGVPEPASFGLLLASLAAFGIGTASARIARASVC